MDSLLDGKDLPTPASEAFDTIAAAKDALSENKKDHDGAGFIKKAKAKSEARKLTVTERAKLKFEEPAK